jgi:hypothetical protein
MLHLILSFTEWGVAFLCPHWKCNYIKLRCLGDLFFVFCMISYQNILEFAQDYVILPLKS